MTTPFSGVFCRARSSVLDTDPPDLMLLDQKLPDAIGTDHLSDLSARCPVVVLTAHGSVDQAVGAVKAGAADYLTKPISPRMLDLAIERVFESARLRNEVGLLRREVQAREAAELIGRTPQIETLRERAKMLAAADMAVLIQGESGAGKRTVARFIHDAGRGTGASFAELQCARIDGGHLLDELFGSTAPGLLEVARGGTLFLSDIGRMPQVVQRRLAVALERGSFARRGSTREYPLKVRIIAATSQTLAELAGDSGLVPELFYALTAFTLEVPPLRERRSDIPELANHFLERRRFALGEEKVLARKTIERLMQWDWPGNLRELRNVVERGVILSGGSTTILPSHVELGNQPRPGEGRKDWIGVADQPTLEELRNRYIQYLLNRHGQNRRVVAEILGISERNLYRLLSRQQ